MCRLSDGRRCAACSDKERQAASRRAHKAAKKALRDQPYDHHDLFHVDLDAKRGAKGRPPAPDLDVESHFGDALSKSAHNPVMPDLFAQAKRHLERDG